MNRWIVKAGTWASKPLSITEAATLAEKLVNVSEFYCDVTIEFYGTPIAESATFTNTPSNGIKECLMCRDLHDRSGDYCTRCKRISVDEERTCRLTNEENRCNHWSECYAGCDCEKLPNINDDTTCY